MGKGQVQGPQPRMEEGSGNSYVEIEPNAGCMAQYWDLYSVLYAVLLVYMLKILCSARIA
jgi:hypothetical protein